MIFVFYRFLTGLGVGGEFAVGVSLLAEVVPARARPHALGWLQACSTIGNVTANFIAMVLGLASLEMGQRVCTGSHMALCYSSNSLHWRRRIDDCGGGPPPQRTRALADHAGQHETWG